MNITFGNTSSISKETQVLHEVSMLNGVGPAMLRKALKFYKEGFTTMSALAGKIPELATILVKDSRGYVAALNNSFEQIGHAERTKTRILSPLDIDYPELLAVTHDDPVIIYVSGTLAPNNKSVAVVGTRSPTRHGLVMTERAVESLVADKWSIVSGLAVGIDSEAHRAAINANGHTVAVLAHGLHMTYPKVNQYLAREILSNGGALISEYAFGVEPESYRFVKRDRTQAGLARGVIMMQSDPRGGSLHASRASLDYGRWLTVPYPTERDIDYNEVKIQANLILTNGTEEERCKLLRCSSEQLKHLLVIKGRQDYHELLYKLVA